MTTFSERYGFKPGKAIQIDDMDDDLRTELWNCLHPYFQRISYKIVPGSTFFNGRTLLELIADWLWVNVLRKPGDELAKKYKDQVAQLKDYFMNCTWYEAYDFVESVARACSDYDVERLPEFVEACNVVLKRERSAYRFVDLMITPVTSEHEIAGIEEALAATGATANLDLVNTHLEQALALLSDRTAPDYRNSMKESISAVECFCKLIAGNPDATLGQALQAIQRPGSALMHADMQEALRRLYHYTSDASGIRHALKDAPNVDVEDARFMLVSCAGFISYLIEKARQAGIAL